MTPRCEKVSFRLEPIEKRALQLVARVASVSVSDLVLAAVDELLVQLGWPSLKDEVAWRDELGKSGDKGRLV